MERLLAAVRAINPRAEIHILQAPGPEELWVIAVTAHDLVLVETAPGSFEKVLAQAAKRLENFSQRILRAVQPEDPDTSK